jgi:hypothetical protein
MLEFPSSGGPNNEPETGVGSESQLDRSPFQRSDYNIAFSNGRRGGKAAMNRWTGLIWIMPREVRDGPGCYLNVKEHRL